MLVMIFKFHTCHIILNKLGFMPEKSTIDAIRLIRYLWNIIGIGEKICIWFLSTSNRCYDNILREVLWRCLEAKVVEGTNIELVNDMYNGVITSVRIVDGDID